MVTFTEAQIMSWIMPVLWAFFRILGLFTSAPVLSMRSIPRRVRISLAALIALAAQPSLVPPGFTLNSPELFGSIIQQVMIGLSIGFAARLVFAAVEFGGELIGLQMGLNFAAFFDPTTSTQATVVSRFYSTLAAWLFIVLNGHLLLTATVIQSFQAFPVAPHPLAFLSQLQPQSWGSELFRLGLWIALPIMAMLLLVNMILGIMSRVASQLNLFAIGFPITLSVGLVGLWLTLTLLQNPITTLMQQLLSRFQ